MAKRRPLKMEIDHDPGTQLDALLRKLDEVRDAIVEVTHRIDDLAEVFQRGVERALKGSQ